MDSGTEAIVNQLQRALDAYAVARTKSQYDDLGDLGEQETKRISTLLYATIERLTPAGSVYRTSALTIREKYAVNPHATLAHFVGIVEALKSDYEDGYMHSLQELLHAEMFADFLEMADHLLEEGYKDPAAVLTGGVLEEHLRTLGTKNGLPTDDGTRRSRQIASTPICPRRRRTRSSIKSLLRHGWIYGIKQLTVDMRSTPSRRSLYS